jgi:hypothetical protein
MNSSGLTGEGGGCMCCGRPGQQNELQNKYFELKNYFLRSKQFKIPNQIKDE